MRTVAIIQARMSSTRLPGKVLMQLGEREVLGWCVRAAQSIPGVDAVVVATSEDASDDVLAAWCATHEVTCVRGSLHDVLARYAKAARETKAQIVLRLTADCPLLDPQVCGQLVQLLKMTKSDYVSNVAPRTWADGLDCEVFTAEALYQAERDATRQQHREHVTPYIRNNQHLFKVMGFPCPLPDLALERWTLDSPEDLAFLTEVVQHLPCDRPPHYIEVIAALQKNPQLKNKNTIAQATCTVRPPEKTVAPSFAISKRLLAQAESVIPQGSQTFSKSARQYPVGHAPLFITHGEGGRVWDVDGNEYIDLVCGLLPVLLGYADPDVDWAIRQQLNRGISFSLATELEAQLAKRISQMVPCAEKMRFAKNGTDATSAAIRVARAYTNRERVMVCGYHGWQDWYIGSTSRFKGVPEGVRNLSHQVPYNNLAAIEKLLLQHKGEFAAMMMEPVNAVIPDAGYLQGVKDLLHKHGALLIFDEVITGFRMAKGGAQEYFGVTPDLASFGKALGNGMPISAIAGRSDVMREMEDIFFSGTFGGETLSLAAAIAVVDKINREPVIETIWKHGGLLRDGVNALLKKYGMEEVLILRGLAPWMILDFQPHPQATKEAIKTRFITDMAKYGVLIIGSHNICYAHGEGDIQHLIGVYDVVLQAISADLASGELVNRLPCAPLIPAFVVR